jgi:hypothetical protein
VIVLVDETESFGEKGPSGDWVAYWPDMLALVGQEVVMALEPGDRFMVIGIDDHGFDSSDARVGPVLIDERTLMAPSQKRKLRAQVQALERRQQGPGTDVVGALQYAQRAALMEKGFRPCLIALTDLLPQTAHGETQWPEEAETAQTPFPEGTSAFFGYVNATGKSSWETILQHWQPALAAMKVGAEERYYQRPETAQKLSEFMTWLTGGASSGL